MEESFRVFFNQNKQFFKVYLHDVAPITFKRRGGGRWGYWLTKCKNPRKGLFGELHLVKSQIRPDTIAHELDHLRCAWLFKKFIIITPHNEEWYCTIGDELHRRFWREYDKYQKRTYET